MHTIERESQTIQPLTIRLNEVWGKLWREVFGTHAAWVSDPAKCKDIQRRLVYFSDNHVSDPDHIDEVIQALSKGICLMKSALEWQEPAIGHHSTEKLNTTHKARGIQWRLVMTWGGFETIAKTLFLRTKSGGFEPEFIASFTGKCHLPSYQMLNPPQITRANLEKWLNKPDCEHKSVMGKTPTSAMGKTPPSAIADFLSLENGDKTMIEQWLVRSTPISTWVEAIRLAKALRNATAHGALSATKVKQWGLQTPMLTLADNLGEVILAGMWKLMI